MKFTSLRAHLASFLAVSLAACGGEAPADPAPPAPAVEAAAEAPTPAEPVVVATTPAARFHGAWDAYARRAVLSIEVEDTSLGMGPQGGPLQSASYTLVGDGDVLTVHMVEEDGEVSDEPLVLIGSNIALFGAPPRQMLLARRGVDLSTDPAALPLRGTWLAPGELAYTFAENGMLTTNNGSHDTPGGYRVVEVTDEGVTIVHWIDLPGAGPIGHSVARVAITGDQMTWTFLPDGTTRELTRRP